MNNDKRVNDLAKILVPILVIVAVIAVWFAKNNFLNDDGDIVLTAEDAIYALEADENFELSSVFEQNLPVILDFGASWCEPCQLMKPTMVKLNEKLKGRVIIKYIDVDELSELSSTFPVTVVPTQFFYTADGAPFLPETDLPIEFIMYEYKDTSAHALTAHEGYLDEQELLMILEKMGLEATVEQ